MLTCSWPNLDTAQPHVGPVAITHFMGRLKQGSDLHPSGWQQFM